MPVKMRNVLSSHINRIGYDADAQEFHVEYDGGKMAVYEGVPPDVAASVSSSASIGEAMYAHVRGKFPHRYQ